MRPEDLLARLEAGYAYDPMYGQLCNERDQLKTENAKLRELVRDMYKSMDVSCQFGHAIHVGTMAHVKNRAIGLGIEVDT